MSERFNAKLSVSDLDFDSIKSNLKEYLSKQDEFKDINFEGAGINILMDMLSYNTHYQAFYTNMVANEMFLDSALKRNSIVSIAKHLGYTPSSIRAATAIVDFYATGPQVVGDTIPKGTIIQGTQGNTSLLFSTLDDAAYTYDSEGNIAAINIVVAEGAFENISYVVDNSIDQKFLIPSSADITTVNVRIQESIEDSTGFADKWQLSSDFNTIEKEDKAFHIQEVSLGEYEIYFGDDIVGKKPKSGNVVIIDYLSTSGGEANGFGRTDKEGSRIFQYSDTVVKVISPAGGGGDPESNNSIKFYAPKSYQAQNRSVTTRDYEALLLRDYPDIDSVVVWGGQENDPPEYGKVFIAIKPKSGLTIDTLKKRDISENILKQSNVVSVIPEIVDPDYIFMKIHTKFTYDSAKTILAKNEMISIVNQSINDYVSGDLEKFDKDLYFSKLSKIIDTSSEAIIGNEISIQLEKRFAPRVGVEANYKIPFGNSIRHHRDGDAPIISSSIFVMKDDENAIRLSYLEDDGYGEMRIYSFDSLGNKEILYTGKDDVGVVDYKEGIISLKDFRPLFIPNNTYITIKTTPQNNNIFATQKQILTIDSTDPESTITEAKTTVETSRGRPGISTDPT
jgi:hypothetical protein